MATCLLKGVRLLTCLSFFLLNIFFPSAVYKKIKISVILRGGYAYSRGYVYCFCQMFQGLRLFKGVRLFRSLEQTSLILVHNIDVSRTTDAHQSLVSSKYQTFGLWQTIWAGTFWGIWGTFGRFISTHFGTVSPLSMFSINQLLFLQKTKSLYTTSQIFIWNWDFIWAAKK